MASLYSMKPKPFMSLISVISPVPWALKWVSTSDLVALFSGTRESAGDMGFTIMGQRGGRRQDQTRHGGSDERAHHSGGGCLDKGGWTRPRSFSRMRGGTARGRRRSEAWGWGENKSRQDGDDDGHDARTGRADRFVTGRRGGNPDPVGVPRRRRESVCGCYVSRYKRERDEEAGLPRSWVGVGEVPAGQGCRREATGDKYGHGRTR